MELKTIAETVAGETFGTVEYFTKLLNSCHSPESGYVSVSLGLMETEVPGVDPDVPRVFCNLQALNKAYQQIKGY